MRRDCSSVHRRVYCSHPGPSHLPYKSADRPHRPLNPVLLATPCNVFRVEIYRIFWNLQISCRYPWQREGLSVSCSSSNPLKQKVFNTSVPLCYSEQFSSLDSFSTPDSVRFCFPSRGVLRLWLRTSDLGSGCCSTQCNESLAIVRATRRCAFCAQPDFRPRQGQVLFTRDKSDTVAQSRQ